MKKKIFVLIDQMECGGAGRVTSTLIPGLIQKGYEVVIALDNANCRNFYLIPDDVRQISIPIKSKDFVGIKQVKLIYAVRRIIKVEKPDLIIAVTFFPFFYAHYATKGLSIPIICYDHTSFGRDMGTFINWIRYSLYGNADKLAILTEKDKRLLGNKFPNKEVVYNPLTYPVDRQSRKRNKTILCAGRLDAWRVKGFDRIIEIWGGISKKYPDWRLQIAGTGSESNFEEIKKMVVKAQVEDSVDFLGQVVDMTALYSKTAIFALPSRVEGFPMVLLEAMSQGCICVSYEMEGAVYEIMSQKSGVIIKDGSQELFSLALEHLIDEFPDYYERQSNGYSDAERFSCENYYTQWDRMIKETISKKK